MEPPLRVVAIVYPDHETAERAFEKVRELDREGRFHVQHAALVQAHHDGQLEIVSTHRHAVRSAGKAAFWGLLLGGALALPVIGLVVAGSTFGLATRVSGRAQEQEFAERVRELLRPGHAGVFVTGTVGSATPDELIAELAPFGGELAQSSILGETEAKLRRALLQAGEDAEEDAPAGGA